MTIKIIVGWSSTRASLQNPQLGSKVYNMVKRSCENAFPINHEEYSEDDHSTGRMKRQLVNLGLVSMTVWKCPSTPIHDVSIPQGSVLPCEGYEPQQERGAY